MPRTVVPAAFITLILVFLTAQAWETGLSSPGIDYYQFWAVGRVAGGPDAGRIYTEEGRREIGERFLRQAESDPAARSRLDIARYRQVLETYSSPFLYTVFHGLGTGDYERDYLAFQTLSTAGSMIAVFLLCRGIGLLGLEAGLALAVTVGAFQPFLWDIRAGNVNRLQLALLCLFLWLRKGSRSRHGELWSGLVLGLALAFKPNIIYAVLLLLIAWAAAGRWRTLWLTVAGMALAALISVAFTWPHYGGPAAWGAWIAALGALPERIITLRMGNYSLSRLLLETLGLRVSVPLTVLTLALAALTIWRRARIFRQGSAGQEGKIDDHWSPFLWDAHVISLGCLVFLITTPLAWGHYLLLALPAVLLVLGAPPRPGPWVSWLTVAAVVLLETSPLQLFLRGLPPEAIALVSSSGLLLLLALLLSRFPIDTRPRGG